MTECLYKPDTFGGATIAYAYDDIGNRIEAEGREYAANDYMGRRSEYLETVDGVTNKHERFVYDGYLCVQRLNGENNAIADLFEWDSTEKVATRPLYWQIRQGGSWHYFYLHDGNKPSANASRWNVD